MKIFADFISAVKTACLNRTSFLIARKNNKVLKLCLALEDLGYISGFTILNDNFVKVFLRYYRRKSVIRTLNLYSKSSSRIYLKKKNLTGFRINSFIKNNNFTLFFTNASPFFLTDIELYMLGIGGEPALTVG